MKRNEPIEIVGLIATSSKGGCREVLEVAVVDYGGNECGRATTPRGVRRIQNRLRINTTLHPVKLGRFVGSESHHPDFTIDCGYCE